MKTPQSIEKARQASLTQKTGQNAMVIIIKYFSTMF